MGRYPHRPHNHSATLPFHDLYLTLFNPLNENKKKVGVPAISRKKYGPHGPSNPSPQEAKQNIIDRFISRWRKEVGPDIYPAFRLIIPDKDRERPMYGLKENTIAKLLIDVMKINKQSEDGYNLLNWKQPSNATVSKMAGDFAGRCHEVISKRPMRTAPGNMTIAEVNDLLDDLAAVSKKEDQLPILTQFYTRMNADELMWLIRIILRQMKIGATERTFFHMWHPDAESLFNVSSNLRRVCWELYDLNVRLEGDDRGVTLMQCFQPQLAQFQMRTFQMMINRMRPTEDDAAFWIEEKLDGERMQLHMVSDDQVPGGKRFCFWSRKAKDYTYLYGGSFEDDTSALTRHLKTAFHQGVQNIILDGEMITWDPEQDAMVPFGTLKTAANLQQANPFSQGWRPLYKVFDVLYLNDQALANYTLRDRRKALESAIIDVPQRLEIHKYVEAETVADVEKMLKTVVEEASEGLVLKNPRSAYRLNERNDDWIKVKPEYLTEFGESLDCCIVGGYYGSGKRGGKLSSFLCGLRVDESHVRQGANPMQFYSFFKVGGGFTATDYAAIRHQTDGKWRKWDPKNPPTEYVVLGGDHLQRERPDEWIMPTDSVIVEVKAASVASSDRFKVDYTLRFPRFKKIRTDRTWENALSISEFISLRKKAEAEHNENQMKVDDSRRKRPRLTRKKQVTVAGGSTTFANPFAQATSKLFEGLDVYVMTGCQKPQKKTKAELEDLVKSHGGELHQTNSKPGSLCIADNRTVHVAAAIKRGDCNVIRPLWIFDNLEQDRADGSRPPFILPLEARHMLFTHPDSEASIANSTDERHDSYARDVSVDELREIFLRWPAQGQINDKAVGELKADLTGRDQELANLPGWVFEGLLICFYSPRTSNGTSDSSDSKGRRPEDIQRRHASNIARFAGAQVTDRLSRGVTHVLVDAGDLRLEQVRREVSHLTPLPRLVKIDWITECWAAKTRLDEERFAPVGSAG